MTTFTTGAQLLDFLESEALVPGERAGLSALDHGLECAHLLAIVSPADIELQVAGLVHDIGHRLVPGDDAGHGRHGAEAVAQLLGPTVAALVELHVPAKRYLVAKDPGYGHVLSDTSVTTLGRQGGPMSPLEAAEFETGRYFDAVIALRRADDGAKTEGRAVPGLDVWARPILELAGRGSAWWAV